MTTRQNCGHCKSGATESHCEYGRSDTCPWLRCLACSWITRARDGKSMAPKEVSR